MDNKLGARKWIALILVGLFGQFAWTIENMYFNVFLYNTISTDPRYISAMVGASAVVATLTTLLMGALSDRVGKRRVFIALGYILWGFSTAAFGLITPENAARLFPAANAAAAAALPPRPRDPGHVPARLGACAPPLRPGVLLHRFQLRRQHQRNQAHLPPLVSLLSHRSSPFRPFRRQPRQAPHRSPPGRGLRPRSTSRSAPNPGTPSRSAPRPSRGSTPRATSCPTACT